MYRLSRRQPVPSEPLAGTRLQNSFPLKLDTPRTDKFLPSVCYQGPRLWLELPGQVKKLEYDKFCNEIRKLEMDEMVQL